MKKPEERTTKSKDINQLYLKTTSEHYRRKNRLALDTSPYAVLKVMKQVVR